MLQKILKSFKSNIIFKNWSLLTVANIFQQLIIFITFIRIARLLGPEQFGKFSSIIVIAGIGQVIATLGFNKILVREVAREPKEISNIAKASLGSLFIAIIATSILLGAYTYFVSNQNIFVATISLPILLMSLTLWNYFEAFAFGLQNMKVSAILNIIGFLLLAIVIYIIPKNIFELVIILNIYVAVHFIRAVGYIFWANKRNVILNKNNIVNNSINVKSILSKSLPYWGTKLLAVPTMQLPILFLEWNSNVSEVGYFYLSTKLSMPITLIITNLLNAVFPLFSKKYSEDIKNFKLLSKKVFIIIFVASVIFAFITGLFSKEIILLIWGDAYFSTIRTFSVQVWSVVIILLFSLFGTIFVSANHEKKLVIISTVNAFIVGLSTYLGSFYGALGLAVSFWIGYVISFGFTWFYIYKWIDIKFSTKFIISITIVYFIFSFISAMIVLEPLIVRFTFFVFGIITIFFFRKKIFNQKKFSFN
jgi:O-antigen/teichoic acid export membrane protein